jgi:hypothetical protein
MPKIFGRTVSPVVLVGVGAAAAYLGFTAFFPEEPAAPTVKKPATKKASVKATGRAIAYTEDDYKLRYASYNEPVHNTFKPLVVRKDANALAANASPGGVPANFAGGDGNWVYSGRVVVNGVNQGLLENPKTGDAEFVVRGQHWRASGVVDITADSITLSGPDGATITLQAGAASEPSEMASVSAANPPEPVTLGPGLQGEIGVQPVPGNMSREDRRARRQNRRNWDNTTGMED